MLKILMRKHFRKNVAHEQWHEALLLTDVNAAYDQFIEVFKSHYASAFSF